MRIKISGTYHIWSQIRHILSRQSSLMASNVRRHEYSNIAVAQPLSVVPKKVATKGTAKLRLVLDMAAHAPQPTRQAAERGASRTGAHKGCLSQGAVEFPTWHLLRE